MLNGVLVNSGAIILGSLLGVVFRNITAEMKETVTKGIGLSVLALGIQMAIKTHSFTIIVVSLSLGAMVGEKMDIEGAMNRLGIFLEKKVAKEGSNFAEGFVTASLIFVIGSMGIVGSIQSGISGDHTTLYTKAVMDGFVAIMLTASLGVGVLFSAVPILLYQGSIAILASLLVKAVPPELLTQLMGEISAIGGLLIFGIGLNLMKITYIRISNFLPGILILIAVFSLQYFW